VKAECVRIVSLLPAATEWLGFLGHTDRLVGISHQCEDPSEAMRLPRLTHSRIRTACSSGEIDRQVRQQVESETSLYELDVERLESLKPDLIVTQSLCGVCAISDRDVETVARNLDCQRFDLRGVTLGQTLEEVTQLAELVGGDEGASAALSQLRARVEATKARGNRQGTTRPRTTLLEWTDPLFCSGHWTPELIQWAGGIDPIGQVGRPSRQIEFDELAAADPDILLVACCGMDLDRTRTEWSATSSAPQWRRLRCVRDGHVYPFDGSIYFNRSGPRLVDAMEQVAAIIESVKMLV
jgi:iron complex transport system substrate-binding protein